MTFGAPYPGQPQPTPSQGDDSPWTPPRQRTDSSVPPQATPQQPAGTQAYPAATPPGTQAYPAAPQPTPGGPQQPATPAPAAPPQGVPDMAPPPQTPAANPTPPGMPHMAPPPANPFGAGTTIRPAQMPSGGYGTPVPPGPGLPPGIQFPQPPQRPPRGRPSTAATLVVIVALLAVTALMGSAMLFGRGDTATLGDPEISLPPSPTEGDPPEVREEWLLQTAQVELDASATALLNGNADGWLDVYDESIQPDMQKRYDSLAQLSVSSFDYQILSGKPIDKGDGTFQLRLAANYCLGGKIGDECAPTAIFFDTDWTDSDGDVRITNVEESYDLGPRPWEVEDLEARVGDRVIVAAPPKYADQLDDVLPDAEAAAENADQYAAYGEVERYTIYLAGDDEFQRWYGLNDPMTNVVGFAIPLNQADENGNAVPGGSDVVVHADRVAGSDKTELISTLRHELGHVATLHHSPEHEPQEEEWWMSEGVAELIDHDPANPVEQYLRAPDVEEYVDRDLWKGDIEPATNSDDALSGSAKYGIAFYATYYLFDEYGQDKFMDFFEMVARNGEDVDESAQEVYGESYSDLEKEMTGFVKDTVG